MQGGIVIIIIDRIKPRIHFNKFTRYIFVPSIDRDYKGSKPIICCFDIYIAIVINQEANDD